MRSQERRQGNRQSLIAFLLVSALAWGLAAPAHADQEDRPVPDYTGREEPDPTAGDVLIWVPKVVLYPVYLVTEYLVRWPIGTTLTWIEEERVFEKIGDFFSVGDAPGDFGLFPTFFVEFGTRASIGFYAWGEGLPTPEDQTRVHFAWGGEEWWLLSARQRFGWGESRSEGTDFDRSFVGVEFILDYRPDHLFGGFETNGQTPLTRFDWEQMGGVAETEIVLGQGDGLVISSSVIRNSFGTGFPDRDSGELSIEQVHDIEDEEAVPGFGGYVLSKTSFNLILDTRPPPAQPGSGVRLDLFGSYGADLESSERMFVAYGTDFAFLLDLSGWNHTLGIRQRLELSESLGDLPVPLVEQVALGGNTLRGFEPGRFRGASGTVTTVQYTYPIWVFLDGFAFVEAGNTFGDRFKGFDFAEMVGSFGLGIRSSNNRDMFWNVILGFGTTPFGSGDFGVDGFRVLLGVSRGV